MHDIKLRRTRLPRLVMRPYEGEGQRTPGDPFTSASIISATRRSVHAHVTRGLPTEKNIGILHAATTYVIHMGHAVSQQPISIYLTNSTARYPPKYEFVCIPPARSGGTFSACTGMRTIVTTDISFNTLIDGPLLTAKDSAHFDLQIDSINKHR